MKNFKKVVDLFVDSIRSTLGLVEGVTDENCFDQLLKIFKIGKRLEDYRFYLSMGGPDESYQLLAELPYCDFGEGYDIIELVELMAQKMPYSTRNDQERVKSFFGDCVEKSRGCKVKDLKHLHCYDAQDDLITDLDVWIAYGDEPTKDSIAIIYRNVAYTLAYLEKREQDDPLALAEIKALLRNSFFRKVRSVIDIFLRPFISMYMSELVLMELLEKEKKSDRLN